MHSFFFFFFAICTALRACCFHNLSWRESEREKPSAKGRGASEKQEKEVQSSSEWVCVSEREKVRVGWPCYQLGWVGQAGRRLLSTGRDRQMLALLPGQNISPGAGSTQSGPGSCNPNDHWWRCTWPTDQLRTHSAPPPNILYPHLPLPFYSTPRPSVSSLTSNASLTLSRKLVVFAKSGERRRQEVGKTKSAERNIFVIEAKKKTKLEEYYTAIHKRDRSSSKGMNTCKGRRNGG